MVLMVWGCGEAGDDAAPGSSRPDAGSAVDAELVDFAVDAAPDAAASVDGALHDAQSTPEPSGLPFIPGPPPATFDCTADAEDFPRRAGSPPDCVDDLGCTVPLVVGHRGAGGQFSMVAPENSMAALRAAALMGLDGVELDVRHTRDGGLVVIHDSTVDRTTFGAGRVDEMTVAEVTALSLRPEGHPDLRGDFSCERVPALTAVLDFVRGRFFVDLDVKTDRVDLVVAAVVAADALDHVYFSTGNIDHALRARALEPRLRVQIRPDTVDEYASAMARFERAPEVVEIPQGQLEAMAPVIARNGQRVFVNVFGLDTQTLVTGEPAYAPVYMAGAHILQSEFPHLVLTSLGR